MEREPVVEVQDAKKGSRSELVKTKMDGKLERQVKGSFAKQGKVMSAINPSTCRVNEQKDLGF